VRWRRRFLPNLGCFRHNRLYTTPLPAFDGVHFIKRAGGMRYVSGLLQEGRAPNKTLCRIMAGDPRL
jgi:hypothetical protein